MRSGPGIACVLRSAADPDAFDGRCGGWCYWIVGSIQKDGPADVVAADLILEDEFPDRVGQLSALPVALHSPSFGVPGEGCQDGLDGVRGSAKFVLRYVANAGSLTGGVCSKTCSAAQRPGGPHGVSTSSSSLHHAHLTACPGPNGPYRLAWPEVCGSLPLEEVQDVLGAVRGPQGKEPLIRINERPATPDRDQTRVTDRGKDHAYQPATRLDGSGAPRTNHAA